MSSLAGTPNARNVAVHICGTLLVVRVRSCYVHMYVIYSIVYLMRYVSGGNKLVCCVYQDAVRVFSIVDVSRSFVRKGSVSQQLHMKSNLQIGYVSFFVDTPTARNVFARVVFTLGLYITCCIFHCLRNALNGNNLICCVYPQAVGAVSIVESPRSFARNGSIS